ncbi:MAG: hypothetical protein JSS30_05140 [Verrucomicrobia bacterium]|nr:hypothetical protein [Verrucomicrobiota bacterium]
MNERYFVSSHKHPVEVDIYADKSALVLVWLLREGVRRAEFSLREIASEIGVSVGLVQKVIGALVLKGLLQTKGVRTAKKFSFKKSKSLLESWLNNYSFNKKCKIRNYYSAFQEKSDLIDALSRSKFNKKVVLGLHSAAELHGYKNTNLNTLELYMLDPSDRFELEKILQLTPQERGYEVLLIEPYYKTWLSKATESGNIKISPILLTFLDLYHFPLRGQEQAEFISERNPELKQIYRGN